MTAEPELWALVVLVCMAGLAGWVDAVVGGGGLLQLPALTLLLPDGSPAAAALGTNKMSSVAGTTMASITYARRVKIALRVLIPVAIAAFVGSTGGAFVARMIPKDWLEPVVLVAMIVVACLTLPRRELGLEHDPRPHSLATVVRVVLLGVVVGLYDGVMGPGTGSFFVLGFVAVLGYGFVAASAMAKLANLTTNVASLMVFGFHGDLVLITGACMAAANLVGGYVGARTALAGGNAFVRKVFFVVFAVLISVLAVRVLF